MIQKNEWSAIEARLSAKSASASLIVCLSRSFVRFQAQSGIKKQLEREPSYSAKRTVLELPQPQTLSQIGGAVLDAFTSLTAQLPDDLRLPYQLHLEGLINEEISALLGIDESALTLRIQNAKNYLKEPATWKRAS
jgi:DNA-directed RNA polymerase specialized sigma24 family protein